MLDKDQMNLQNQDMNLTISKKNIATALNVGLCLACQSESTKIDSV